MAKNNPSLADLSRMRREAKQSNKAETAQKPYVEEAKTVELKEQTSSVQSDSKSKISNDSKLKIVPESKPVEIEEQKRLVDLKVLEAILIMSLQLLDSINRSKLKHVTYYLRSQKKWTYKLCLITCWKTLFENKTQNNVIT